MQMLWISSSWGWAPLKRRRVASSETKINSACDKLHTMLNASVSTLSLETSCEHFRKWMDVGVVGPLSFHRKVFVNQSRLAIASPRGKM